MRIPKSTFLTEEATIFEIVKKQFLLSLGEEKLFYNQFYFFFFNSKIAM